MLQDSLFTGMNRMETGMEKPVIPDSGWKESRKTENGNRSQRFSNRKKSFNNKLKLFIL